MIIIVMQRIHFQDLVGQLLDLDDWTVLELPAEATTEEQIPIGEGRTHRRVPGDLLHPAREDLKELETAKRLLGSRAYAAQYQQAPLPPEGDLLKDAWFKRYEIPPAASTGSQVVQSWDMASSLSPNADYSVCTTWAVTKEGYYLLDVYRARLEHPDLLRQVRRLAHHYKAQVILIEDADIGRAVIQTLRREADLNIIAIKPKLDKQTRAEQQSATIEAGRVFIPEEAIWLAAFLDEVLSFPGSPHDDQVDSLTQFLHWIRLHQRQLPEMSVRTIDLGLGRSGDRYFDRTGISIFRPRW